MTGQELIAAERQRQIEHEGWTAEHDEQHSPDDLKHAAHCYLVAEGPNAEMPPGWPWGDEWWKPKDRQRNLVRAGALYLAAADRAGRDKDDLGIYHLTVTTLRGYADNCARLIDKLLTANV